MGPRLKEMLDSRGISVSAFARSVGIPQPTMHRIASGKVPHSSVTVGNYMKIAHALGLSVEELYYDEPDMMQTKTVIDRAYYETTSEGRRAMVANARGVLETYPPSGILPMFREDR